MSKAINEQIKQILLQNWSNTIYNISEKGFLY